ncbi:MAG: hypothetical protein NVS9B13_20890 [Candidatus Acidiferrum sp.]
MNPSPEFLFQDDISARHPPKQASHAALRGVPQFAGNVFVCADKSPLCLVGISGNELRTNFVNANTSYA